MPIEVNVACKIYGLKGRKCNKVIKDNVILSEMEGDKAGGKRDGITSLKCKS